MSDSAFNPGNLLSSLTANPELLKNAMQMASALASSGMLNGLFNKEEDSQKGETTPGENRQTGFGAGGASTTDFASLLNGLLGQNTADSFAKDGGKTAPFVPSSEHEEERRSASASLQNRKKSQAPCHNDRIHLLKSIRPFLPEEKRDKIDFLVQLLGLLYAAEQLGLGKLF